MTFGTAAQLGGTNVCAFLDAIAVSEIGAALLSKSDNGYNCLVGSTPMHPALFSDYSQHPDIFNKQCNSDAAGRYQIMHRWWLAYGPILHLPDFSPLSQDLYAVRQLKERDAFLLILAGDFAGAVAKCSNIWASLPGSQYGQHVNAMSDLQAAYVSAGGVVA